MSEQESKQDKSPAEVRCTLLCRSGQPGDVLQFLRNKGIEYTVSETEDEAVSVAVLDAKLRLHIRVRKRAGDRLSKTVLGLYSHFGGFGQQKLSMRPAGERDALIRLSESRMSVGVVRHATKGTESIVQDLAHTLDALVFDGNQLRDSEGHTLLGS